MLTYSYYGADRRNYIVFGLAYVQRSPGGKPEIIFRWDRILLVLTSLAVIAWLSGSLALYFFFKYKRNFDDVSFAKMLILPIRYEKHKREMGEFYIKKGNQAWEEEDYQTAIGYLRAGLPRVPDDFETRKKVAQVFFFRPTTALPILEDGLEYEFDRDYLIFLFQAYSSFRYDKELIETANKLLQRDLPEDQKKLVFAFKASALYQRGRYEEASRLIEEENLIQTPDGILLTSQMKWGRGKKEEAIDFLTNIVLQNPNFNDAFVLLDQFLRAEERFKEAMRYAILRSTSDPLAYQPRIAIMHNFADQDQQERVQQEVESFLLDFRRNENALLELAFFAGTEGYPEITESIFSQFKAKASTVLPGVAITHAQALNAAKRPADALRFMENLPDEIEMNDFQEAQLLGILALSYLQTGEKDVADYHLTQLLASSELRPDDLLRTAMVLENYGFKKEAVRILEKAYLNSPDNQIALNLLVRTKVELEDTTNLSRYLEKIFTEMRRPDYDLLFEAQTLLASDRYLFSYKRDTILDIIQKLISGQTVDTQNLGIVQ